MIPLPSRSLLVLLTVPLLFLAAGLALPFLLIIGIAIDIALLVVCLYDYLKAVHPENIALAVSTGRVYSIGRKNAFRVKATNMADRPLRLELILDLPGSWQDATVHRIMELPPAQADEYRFELLPRRRGVFTLTRLHFRYRSGAGLFMLQAKKTIDCRIEVYPDIMELHQYLALSRRNRLTQIGIHKDRYQGMGNELESLREYQRDDDANNIDWKVSTRVHRPVIRVFQWESAHQVVFALDCGRLMSGVQAGLNTLDHAVNAILILGHIVGSMGDQLGMIAYADRILGELPLSRGKDAARRLARFVAPLKPGFVESNHKLAFEYLHRRLKRRSLIIFFSDLIDDIHYPLFRKYFTLLGSKHLALVILLRDILLEKYAEGVADNLLDVCTAAAARDMLLRRSDAVAKLKLGGINVLDLLPGSLTPKLVDKYLEIKARSRI